MTDVECRNFGSLRYTVFTGLRCERIQEGRPVATKRMGRGYHHLYPHLPDVVVLRPLLLAVRTEPRDSAKNVDIYSVDDS